MDQNLLGVLVGVLLAAGGIAYVWSIAKPKQFDPDKIVTVAVITEPIEAYLWKQRLNSLGIECNVIGEGYRRRSYELQIRAADLAKAQQILSDK